MIKHTLALALFASVACLAPAIASADPTPAPASAKRADPPAKRPAKASFWLAATPHVPLAVVDGKEIRSVGQRGKQCGSKHRWAKPKSRWRAIDAWGQVTGQVEIAGAALYDVTHCREVRMNARSGSEGAGLFVSEDSSWKPSPSAAWSPSTTEVKRLDRFMASIEPLWVDVEPFGKEIPLAKRAMFFKVPGSQERDPNGLRPQRWAVVGGPVLVVAYLGRQGQWRASMVRPPLGLSDSYKPVAVFDLNGDGIPEIVYHASEGATYADGVLSLDPDAMTWEDAAESPGGASL